MKNIFGLILSAGEGKRMKSNKAKVLHKICGSALVEWVINGVKSAGIDEILLVVGHKSEEIKKYLKENVNYIMQEKQLGTGHAVMQATKYLKDKEGYVFILCGDTPLITSKTIRDTIDFHIKNNNNVTVVSADINNPTGYGRIVRNLKGDFIKIVEDKDASLKEKNIKEINSGIYCFNIKNLIESLNKLKNNNIQGEYYLTDTIEILVNEGLKVDAYTISNNEELLGVNDRIQLNKATEIIKTRILNKHLLNGVTIIDKNSTFIDNIVEIESDTVIYPGVIIEGQSVIGQNSIIGPYSRIVSSRIGNNVEINNSIILESCVDNETHVGPFAYIRPESIIGKNVKIGDFVEIKKSIIEDNTKISHLTYVGDAKVGKNVNLGCGVVVVNYDGEKKNETIIEDNVFVGCNANLISPVIIRNNSYIAAGSTITHEVPKDSLAIARSKQTIKEEWVIKNRNLKKNN